MNLAGKKILITAGPTWVPIDSIRVISNIATGETGMLLAEKLTALGGRVTLLLGPLKGCCLNKKIRVINFKFFAELRNILRKELGIKRYDVIIHSAAVSDFRPEFSYKGKIDSAKQQTLKLSPLPKIIRQIRSLNPQAVLVMFKLESRISEARLFERAKIAAEKIAADLVVANLLNPYRAFIITREGRIIPAKDKVVLANRLINEICSFSR